MGLSVPHSTYDGSRLAIPCPGTGPLRRRSSPPLHTAVKPSSSSRRKKRRRGAPSCVSASEEESPTAAAATPGAVTSLLVGGRVAATKPASSSATALSLRLAAAPPMPSSPAPARCSEAAPDELEQQLRFFARQIKTFRKTSLLYSSPELMERIRQMEEDYGTAPTSGFQSAAAAASEQPTPGLQGAASEQPTSGLQSAAAAAAAAVEQPTSGLQSTAEFPEGPMGGLPPRPGPEHLLGFLLGVLMELRPDAQPDSPQPEMTPDPKSASTSSTRRRGRRKRDASAQVIGGPGDASASVHATESFVLGDASASVHATENFVLGDSSASVHATESFVLVLASEPRDEGSPGATSASEGSPGSQPVYEALVPGRPPELCFCFWCMFYSCSTLQIKYPNGGKADLPT
ncbi:hypothetical protein CRENBAI_015067 [Crenichthys baileyi]|uniref:Uncharacterized protein n=1 Tax=Crenichthys baileyi TaxID=28760 RepID=A0AAV9QRC6_9TELE